jgi:hypothetical protein
MTVTSLVWVNSVNLMVRHLNLQHYVHVSIQCNVHFLNPNHLQIQAPLGPKGKILQEKALEDGAFGPSE